MVASKSRQERDPTSYNQTKKGYRNWAHIYSHKDKSPADLLSQPFRGFVLLNDSVLPTWRGVEGLGLNTYEGDLLN